MIDERGEPSENTSQLQEAIDTIAQSFDHPDTISITYTSEDGRKRTTIEVATEGHAVTYELGYDGRDDDAEPELKVIDNDERSAKSTK